MNILPVLVLSCDSLWASFLLSAFPTRRAGQLKLAVAFGLCDAVASLIQGVGDTSGPHLLPWIGPQKLLAMIAVYLAAALLVWLFTAKRSLRLLGAVPVALGLDNLIGPQILPLSIESIALVGLTSASMSFVGFRLATFFVAGIRRWRVSGFQVRRLLP